MDEAKRERGMACTKATRELASIKASFKPTSLKQVRQQGRCMACMCANKSAT